MTEGEDDVCVSLRTGRAVSMQHTAVRTILGNLSVMFRDAWRLGEESQLILCAASMTT